MPQVDFTIHKWNQWYIINAHTTKGEAWMRNHWRSRTDPPNSRATKVARFLSEIIYFWTNYEPSCTVQVDADAAVDIGNGNRIPFFLEDSDDTLDID